MAGEFYNESGGVTDQKAREERSVPSHPSAKNAEGWGTHLQWRGKGGPPALFPQPVKPYTPSGAKPSQCRASVMPRPVVRITSFFSVPAGGNEVYRSLKVVCQLNILPSFELNVESKENWYWPVWLMSG